MEDIAAGLKCLLDFVLWMPATVAIMTLEILGCYNCAHWLEDWWVHF